jgi:hypothetical protein
VTDNPQIRALTSEELDMASGARPFGDCNESMLNFGLFYIKTISCPEGSLLSIGTPLLGGHSVNVPY